jgi:hypothetical protein
VGQRRDDARAQPHQDGISLFALQLDNHDDEAACFGHFF